MKKKSDPKPYKWDVKIIQAIRKVWRDSPERRAVGDAARDPSERKMVKCAICSQLIHEKLAAIDHISPVTPVTGFDSWDAYIHRMKTNQMQVLCESCHRAKTKEENATRRANKPKKEKKCASKKPPREKKKNVENSH